MHVAITKCLITTGIVLFSSIITPGAAKAPDPHVASVPDPHLASTRRPHVASVPDPHLASTRDPHVASARNLLPATALHSFGRTRLNDRNDLELISSAANFGVSFEDTACTITAYLPSWLDHNYLQYELDGVYQKRIRVSNSSTEPIVIRTPGKGRHTLWIYKATEATTGPIYIHALSAHNLDALERPKAPLIEFIGNSITCGAAADPSDVPCGSGVYHDQHNAYLAYGPRVARALHANFLLSSVSGIGIYRNWNSDSPTMPKVYKYTDFQPNSQPWNFATYSPKIVSIALGTNDFSHGDGKTKRSPFDSATFVSEYIRFVQQIISIHPQAQIALLSSPMLNGNDRTLLQNCLTAVKTAIDKDYPADRPVALFFFAPMQPRGCYFHPSVEDHAILAGQLIPFFKNLLDSPKVVFFDDFTAPSLDRSKWNVVVTGMHVNNELQAYVDSDKTIYQQNGMLVIQPIYTPGFITKDGQHFDFISGRIDTRNKFDFRYGTAEARIRMDEGDGLWPAWWILGNGPWPATGEIDIMEFVGEPDWTSAAVHGPGYSGETPFVNRFYFPRDNDVTHWHVYGVDWTPDQLVFRYDGIPMFRVTRTMATHYGNWAFDNKKFLILNMALGGAYPAKVNGIRQPYNGLPQATVDLIRQQKAKIYVDWVKVTQD
jgi:glycosyl hydrolase family 16/carbohydrate esterase-like protein/GDSL-like lipase/acylhydrolase family protein